MFSTFLFCCCLSDATEINPFNFGSWANETLDILRLQTREKRKYFGLHVFADFCQSCSILPASQVTFGS